MNFVFDPGEFNPGQLKYIQATSPFVLLAGGFGSGKTTAGAVKIVQLAAMNPGLPGLVLAPNWTTLKSVVLRALRKLFLSVPRAQLPLDALAALLRIHDPTQERYLDWGGGTHIFLRSMHDVASFDGLDVAWVYGDEMRHATREAYSVAIARVRLKSAPFPQRAFTSTPKIGWLSDEFNTGKSGRELIVAPTLENRANLQEEYIDGLRASYSKRMQRAVIEGLFTVLEGSVYEAFDVRSEQGRKERVLPLTHPANNLRAQNWQKTILAIDPGFRRSAVLWIREIDKLQWAIIHQWMPDNMSMGDVAMRINEYNKAHEIYIDEVHVDPAADSTELATGLDVAAILDTIATRDGRPHTIWCTGIYRGIAYGVDKLATLLGDPQNGLPVRLFMTEALLKEETEANNRGIVKSLEAYAYGEVKDGKAMSDVPVKDGLHDHACDCARYCAVLLWLTTDLQQIDPRLKTLSRLPIGGRR